MNQSWALFYITHHLCAVSPDTESTGGICRNHIWSTDNVTSLCWVATGCILSKNTSPQIIHKTVDFQSWTFTTGGASCPGNQRASYCLYTSQSNYIEQVSIQVFIHSMISEWQTGSEKRYIIPMQYSSMFPFIMHPNEQHLSILLL